MKLDEKPIRQSWQLRYVPRLMVIAAAVIGWFFGHWYGVIFGFGIGCLLGILTWLGLYIVLAKSRRQQRMSEVARLSDEVLKAMAVDLTSRDCGYAILELDRRGITVRPSVETLFELLRSENPNRRAMGFSNLGMLYPEIFEKVAGEKSSSVDSPEVWEQRITAFKAAN